MPHRRREIADGNNDDEPITSYSVRQAALLIKDKRGRPFSRRWLYKEIDAGRVETFKDENGYMRITVEELDRFKAMLRRESGGGGGGSSRASPLENPAWRKARAQAGGWGKSARHSAEEIREPLERGLQRSLENRVDPDHRLRDHNPAELQRRVEALRRSDLARAQAKSHLSRAQ